MIIGDGPARPEIEGLFASFADRVTMLGARAPEELPGCYAAADLLVWPAVNEAFGMALLEAQACGLPVLAGAVGGVPAILHDGETGWLAPPDDPAAFGVLLKRLLEADLAAAGRRARQHIEVGHDIAGAARILDRTWRGLGLSA
jgi:glycosyltransferase involved in cell wall biosynthesis